MNDYFTQFINSNINFLITNEISLLIENEQYKFLNQYLLYVGSVFNNEIKQIVLSKDLSKFTLDKPSFKDFLKEYLDRDVFSSNRLYERTVYKFLTFLFLNFITIIIMTVNIDVENSPDELLRLEKFLHNFEIINSSISKSLILKEILEYVK